MMMTPKILIIEHDADMRKMYRLTLQLEQYQVLEAGDGAEALQIANQHKLDLILQDLVVPDVGCLELNRLLRATPQNLDVMIIALSGFLNSIAHESSCFTAFLLKPITRSQLINTIQIYLPFNEEPKKTQNAYRLLLVDDDPTQLKLLKLQLEYEGYQVTTATNGQDALVKMKSKQPDAVVSDVLMPVKDGFELCLAIRQEPQWSQIPVILLSSNYIEEADRSLGKKVSATDYLMRTASNQELIAALQHCLTTKAPAPTLPSPNLFKEEHTSRMIRQLEHQVTLNFDLVKQCSLQGTQLDVLERITSSFVNKSNLDSGRKGILKTYLHAAGITKGLFFQWINKQYVLEQSVGFSKKEITSIKKIMAETSIFHDIAVNKKVMPLQTKTITNPLEQRFLTTTNVAFALIAPIISESQFLGIVFLGSNEIDLTAFHPLSFAQALGIQLGQSIAISTVFEQLRESEDRYRTLMEHASCGIFVSNLEGKIIEANEVAKKILQYPSKAILGHNLTDFFTGSSQNMTSSPLQKLLLQGMTTNNEIHLKRKDGSEALVEYSAVKVKTSKETLLLSIITDVTERNTLRLHTMLQDRLLMTGTLMAGVAHEINNPVAWILSNLNYLKKELDQLRTIDMATDTSRPAPDLDPANKSRDVEKKWERDVKNGSQNIVSRQALVDNLEEVVQESIKGAERIRDIIHLFKNVGFSSEATKSLIDIHEVLNSVIDVASLETLHRAKLEKNFSANIPPIMSNSGLLHQVFLNLIINAAHSIPVGDITHNTICISTTLEPSMLRVDIKDSGTGIAPEHLAHLFEPFFSTKTKSSGTGLGLFICQEIMRNLGGKIKVQSKQGVGSTFSVYLPLKKRRANS